jgi:DNA segregation ATPase FtsK/SpoIIIE, S-DNA-T family
VQLKASQPDGEKKKFDHRDELYDSAVDIVIREGRGSVSLLQRALGIGYGRAARLIDYMAEDGIVGPYNGSQARDILITLSQWEAMTGQAPTESEQSQQPKPRRNNKILIAPANDDAFDDEEEDVAEDETDEDEPEDEDPDEDEDDDEEDGEDDDDDYEDEAPSDDEEEAKASPLSGHRPKVGQERARVREESEDDESSISPSHDKRWKAESA